MADFIFIPGMEIAHIGNLKQKLYVREAKWKTKLASTGEVKANPKEGFVKQKGSFLEGIEVDWWVDGKKYKDVFHCAYLVPWEIACKGEKEADMWRYDNNIKTFKKVEIELNK